MASSIADAYNITVPGYIYDNLCLYMAGGQAIDGTNVSYGVPDHTVGCMLLDACIKSGFVLRQKVEDGSYTTAYQLSNSSIAKITSFLVQLKTVRSSNVYVKAS